MGTEVGASSVHTAYPAVVVWDRNPLVEVGAGHRSVGPLEEPGGGGRVGVVGLDHIPLPRRRTDAVTHIH